MLFNDPVAFALEYVAGCLCFLRLDGGTELNGNIVRNKLGNEIRYDPLKKIESRLFYVGCLNSLPLLSYVEVFILLNIVVKLNGGIVTVPFFKFAVNLFGSNFP